MKNVMYQVDQVIDLIKQGKNLLLAGDEGLLRSLPEGNWIGGSIPYFMAENGGLHSNKLILVNELPPFVEEINCMVYDIATLKNVYKDGYDNGFSVIIIPASSDTHLSFAINAPDYKDFATKPLIGWISGVALDDLGKTTPKTFIGHGNGVSDKNAVVMHVKLPADKFAELSITNIFKQGNGDTVEFTESGFSAQEAIVNGKPMNFAEYVASEGLDTRLPLVANYNDTMINISFQSVDANDKTVHFYAPVFKGVKYKLAAPVKNYVEEFLRLVPSTLGPEVTFSCNCILNYLYSELEGKKTGNITGPITFGEIAYQLLNQTIVSIEIKNI